MFSNISTFRRLKTRFRRIPPYNIVVCFLTIVVLFFFLTILSQNSKSQDNDNIRLSNPSRLSRLHYNFDNSSIESSLSENQIDEPGYARKSEPPVYREDILGNYEVSINLNSNRPGDRGEPYLYQPKNHADRKKMDKLKREYGINMAASENIPMDRIVPDIRHSECKHWSYPEQLPTTSVVIVFHNEGLTTLVRTAYSVLLRSPRKLIKEVILLDDFSDKKDLHEPLEEYIQEHFGKFNEQQKLVYPADQENLGEGLKERSGKVKLIRNTERGGLIRSRSRGAQSATGDVVLFLDAHCEVNANWLPPLLAPIAVNRKTLTVPIIDGIDSENFAYRPVYSKNDEHFRGIWEWGMLYKEIGLNMTKHKESHRVSEPYDSPTHAGGLFAVDRQFFNDLGLYDPGLLVWGGENFELSFKVWQCGGRLQWIPCSRVGHIYRPFMPYNFGNLDKQRKGPLVLTNYKRVIEVWFDDIYKEYFYTREPLAKFYDPGDITTQLDMKKKLQCKSFDWFMKNVASDVFRDFPRLPKNVKWGEVQFSNTNQCLDTESPHPPHEVIVNPCHHGGGNQLFRLNEQGQLATGERCIDYKDGKVMLVVCKLGTVDGPWKLDGDKILYTKPRKHNLCLSYSDDLSLRPCASDSESQIWKWIEIKPKQYD